MNYAETTVHVCLRATVPGIVEGIYLLIPKSNIIRIDQSRHYIDETLLVSSAFIRVTHVIT
jgi:hypothetical protein